MLGAIINLLNSSDRTSNILSGYTLPNTGISIFGPGRGSSKKVTVTGKTLLTDLAEIDPSTNPAGNLNFEDLTVDGTLFFNSSSYGTVTRDEVKPTSTYPLILRCSGTLEVTSNGHISADGQGNYNDTTHYQSDHRETIYCNIPIKDIVTEVAGYSTNSEVFDRLVQYGANGGFLDPYNFFCGASGGNYGYWKHNNWGSTRSRNYNSYSFTQGGQAGYDPSRSGGKRNRNAGPTGGCIVLYFEDLEIDGKVYGQDPDCDISVIQANGAFPTSGWSEACRGGGMMVIAARHIKISTRNSSVLDRGSITANGVLCRDGDRTTYGFTNSIKQWRWAVLNNYPQLCTGQSGWRIAKNTDTGNIHRYIYEAMPSDVTTYYYDMGMGVFGEANTQTEYTGDFLTSSSNWCGGAGIALGFKIRADETK